MPEPAPSLGNIPIPIATPLPPLGRADLLAAAAAAADSVAAGEPLPQSNLALTNRSFELRLPFACDGGTGSWGSWTFDSQTRVLRVTFRPQSWGQSPLFRTLAEGTDYDAAEGFWIERPWTRSETCPEATNSAAIGSEAGTGQGPGPAAADDTLAIVQYFSPTASRTLRRGSRPYTYTAKLPNTGQADPQGFRIRVIGRISGFADGQPVHCAARDPARPPVCAVAIEFTRVVLEDALTGTRVTDWEG